MIHQVLEIVLFSSVLVVVIANAGGFNAVTGALGNAYGSGFRTVIGLGG